MAPKWRELADRLAAQIRRGDFAPGQQLPHIRDLVAAGEGSKSTVHAAYKALEAEGLVTSSRGHGTSVRPQAPARPVRLVSDQVVLREFTLDDVADVLAIIGNDTVTTWLSFDSRDRAQAVTMIEGTIKRAQQEPRSEFYLGVTKHDDNRVIGFARMGLSGVQAGKLGYAIAAQEWGRGYATDAARTLVTYAFKELGLHRVTAAIGPDNSASIAVVQQLGFTREGVLRDHVFANGSWRDSILYSVLEHEWQA
ncbi:GNAT family N-acetyltransferase [Streptomyces coeruleorubidus]|uniref:GNAT family N-acetyltransferase n=1 Tax=Streptomyces coeruleorubidus TaxID=116188 RepID=A0ABZ0KT53_STRC4|nr:GNAT family N-acetyltransferase [Streptomyces coeruleorubidus]WOT40651.1 GNAT family N-acetyltransferase [Streptomyces coeruleorubidus]